VTQQSQQPEGEFRQEWRRERGSRVMPGLILILLGALFLVFTMGWISWIEWWKYLLVGLGVIFLIDSAVRYAQKARGVFGRLVTGIVLMSIGVAFITGIGNWWPIILVVVGVIVIVSRLVRR